MTRSVLENMADVVARLVRAERTVPELVGVTGMSKDTVRRHLSALQGDGLIEPSHEPRKWRTAPKWRWNP